MNIWEAFRCIQKCAHQALLKTVFCVLGREILFWDKHRKVRNTLCISDLSMCSTRAKDPVQSVKGPFLNAHIKKGAGRIIHSPRCSSRFASELISCSAQGSSSGGQNLAASCTAAGQDLTAIGGSHSLAETVNLGTVTVAGLVGTLHSGYTSCTQISYARQPHKGPQQRFLGRLSRSCLLIIP